MAPQLLSLQASTKKSVHQKRRLPTNFVPGPYAVICGRGKICTSSPGNRNLRSLVRSNLASYSVAKNKAEKSVIVSKIIESVRELSPEGSFVKQGASNGEWWEVDDAFAREKIGCIFRDILHTQYKSSAKAKQARKKALEIGSKGSGSSGRGENEYYYNRSYPISDMQRFWNKHQELVSAVSSKDKALGSKFNQQGSPTSNEYKAPQFAKNDSIPEEISFTTGETSECTNMDDPLSLCLPSPIPVKSTRCMIQQKPAGTYSDASNNACSSTVEPKRMNLCSSIMPRPLFAEAENNSTCRQDSRFLGSTRMVVPQPREFSPSLLCDATRQNSTMSMLQGALGVVNTLGYSCNEDDLFDDLSGIFDDNF